MRKSPSAVHPIYESEDCNASDFNAKVAFVELLNEARQHMIRSYRVASSPNNREHGELYIRKKSWKSSLFSCLKSAKKSNSRVQPAISVNSIRELEVVARGRPTAPAPLSGLFINARRSENQSQYLTPYGPMYFVT
ncbi:hypothetical protein CDL15_Pgr026663 [Punica granatum]|uniref:Uncharacterized protein n=1 Tax=Punica granatum TaxID=22663 RepID=A0A218WL58_PUNGR|nr:hypothetical protein CDL15_Pgr026663 [Punica granatum]PKI41193.1 hypothetical protein CRG98_038409 [Punica granatum]